MMRLTTAIWLGVFMRLEAKRGAYVSVVQKGAQQAGAAFVLHCHRDGLLDVYGPAPQSLVETENSDRLFERVLTSASQQEADEYMERQKRFDPDLWIIETQGGEGMVSLEIAKSCNTQETSWTNL